MRPATRIHPAFVDTPQFIDERLSAELGREVVVKVETLNPIGSFKGRGTWLVAEDLDPERTWVCATAGNFGQGLAYAARARGAHVHVFAAAGAPPYKVERMRALGARVDVSDHAEAAARAYADADPEQRVFSSRTASLPRSPREPEPSEPSSKPRVRSMRRWCRSGTAR